MLTTIAVIALVSVPYVLDVYFNSPHDAHMPDEEYIPDGR